MTRVVKKPGDLFRFPTERGNYGYCQWLPHDARFFTISTSENLAPESVVALPVAFRVPVFRDTPSRYGWQKIGSAPVPRDCEEPQVYVKQDALTKKITVYRGEVESREEKAATSDNIAQLETLAVWAHPHIVERLLAALDGTRSKFLEGVRVKP